jgi:solute carrier family 25 (adenine nucleotide translocator) protein 4/5/6/31
MNSNPAQSSFKQENNSGFDFIIHFLSGGISGAISKTVAAPAERTKLLMQTQSANNRITK